MEQEMKSRMELTVTKHKNMQERNKSESGMKEEQNKKWNRTESSQVTVSNDLRDGL